jgi:hypothetical protein
MMLAGGPRTDNSARLDALGLRYRLRRISFSRQMLGGPEHCRKEAARQQGWFG